MTARCGGLRGTVPQVEQCRPGWYHLPADLRRLLAETWGAAIDGDPDGPALHECAHILAEEYRTPGRVARTRRDAAARYHAGMKAARRDLSRLRGAS